jgi:sulfur relay (sulfurtransferase) DsrC/TusE family protein
MSSLSNLNSLPTQAKAHVCEQAFSSQHKLQKAHFEVIVFLRTLWSTHQLTYSSRNCVRSKKIIVHRYQHKDTILWVGMFFETVPTRMPAVRCRRHKYASIIACCPIINNDTFIAPWTSPKSTVVRNITLPEPIREKISTAQHILDKKWRVLLTYCQNMYP